MIMKREGGSRMRLDCEKTILEKKVTYDFHRLMDGAHLLKTSEFGDALIANINT